MTKHATACADIAWWPAYSTQLGQDGHWGCALLNPAAEIQLKICTLIDIKRPEDHCIVI